MRWDLPDLARVVGEVPLGDPPAAWWLSLHKDVLLGYENWRVERQIWADQYAEMCHASGFGGTPQPVMAGGALVGLLPPPGMTKPPQYWRIDKEGLLVPRRRTTVEKKGSILSSFLNLNRVPMVVEYIPGLPPAIWTHDRKAYPVSVQRSVGDGHTETAVLAFVGVDPEQSTQPFEPDSRWSRMKLSTFYQLRERQTGMAEYLPPAPKPGVMR